MTILKSSPEDLTTINKLYCLARDYQIDRKYNVWPVFKGEEILKEILGGNNWKIVENNEVACVFSVIFNDPIIWKEQDCEPALYLHRISTSPAYRGRKFINVIIDWAKKVCEEKRLRYIRMDTWADNFNLRNYYIMSGFTHVGESTVDKTEALPEHYWGIKVNLFQIEI